MSAKTETIAITLIIINLLIIAAIGYGFEWAGPPDSITMITKGGAVVFDHKLHTLHGTPDLKCAGCHHPVDGGKTSHSKEIRDCRACHYYQKITTAECKEAEVHKRCIGDKCTSCHTKKECGFCHH
jgi:hypothetical protein